MRGYEDLRKIYHQSEHDAKAVYEQRFNSKDAVHVPFSIKGKPAFYIMDSELYKLILEAERLDKSINALQIALPDIAIKQYLMRSLINEIVLTNEIEGVHSSRQEIGEALERLSKNDKRGRFQGIVEKYNALVSADDISLGTCKDIRDLYDDLVLEEVVKEDPHNAPDGELFRKKITHVVNESGIVVHDGIEPESKIIELMDKALAILNDEDTEVLVRVSLFHFMFSFIHPFYDGNGRTNRFISSYVLSRAFSPLPGLRLSFAIKENIEVYYKAFSVCEHPLNQADLTPFILSFSQVVVKAMRSMKESLAEKEASLKHYSELGDKLASEYGFDERTHAVTFILIQASLFSELGVTAQEIASILKVSAPTIYNKLKNLEKESLVIRRKQGRTSYLSLDLEGLETALAT